MFVFEQSSEMIKQVLRRTNHKTQVGVVTEGEDARTTDQNVLGKIWVGL